MWVVAKIKKRELNIFKDNLTQVFGKDIKFYNPKIQYYKHFKNKLRKFEKYILDNYIFCYHKKFNNPSLVNKLQFSRGLEYLLKGHNESQSEIVRFINHCKSFENEKGYLTSNFFKTMINKKAKFISGPFTDMIFEIIDRQKNKLKILVGNIVTTISDKNNYLYRPI